MVSFIRTRHVFRRHFETQPFLSDNAIRTWLNNLEQTGLTTKKRGGIARTVRTPENIERVRQAIQKSLRRMSCNE